MRPAITATGLSCCLAIAGFIAIGFMAIEPAVGDQQNAGHEQNADDETPMEPMEVDADVSGRFNVPIKTGGGTQLWTDHVYRGGYRVQRHAWTGHHRLIDADDVRRCWGTREACQAELDRLQPAPAVDAAPRHVVVLLHGLMRTHHCMKPLEANWADDPDTDVVRFAYASTRNSITDSAAALRETLEAMPATTTFSFVGHSMGNIVVRHLVGDLKRDGDPNQLLARVQSMVMLGPPNQGAAIAKRLAPTGLYGWVTGKGGMELGAQWESFSEKLATPPFPFIIIAGDVSEKLVQNPLVDGSGDFVVSLDEAKLDGAVALETVPVLHSFLMSDAAAQKLTVDFINSHRTNAHRTNAHRTGEAR